MSAYGPTPTFVILSISYDHEVLADDNVALEIFCDRLAPGVVVNAVNGRSELGFE